MYLARKLRRAEDSEGHDTQGQFLLQSERGGAPSLARTLQTKVSLVFGHLLFLLLPELDWPWSD